MIVRLCGVLCLIFLGTTMLWAEAEHSTDDLTESELEAEVEESAGPMLRVPGIARFSPQLKQLCTLMAADGRQALLLSLAEANAIKHEDCPACRDFYRLLERACSADNGKRVRTIKRRKKVEEETEQEEAEEAASDATPIPSPSPIYKQRYPHINVIQSITLMTTEWSKDPFVQGYYEISEHFLAQLKNFASTNAASDYAEVMTEAWLSPFSEFLRKKNKRPNTSKLSTDQPESGLGQKQIDQLFNE